MSNYTKEATKNFQILRRNPLDKTTNIWPIPCLPTAIHLAIKENKQMKKWYYYFVALAFCTSLHAGAQNNPPVPDSKI